MTDQTNPERTGYRRPPKANQFQPGRTGNAKGRPRGSRKASGIPYDSVLGRKVLVTLDGKEQSITAAEAFLLHLAKVGLGGRASASKKLLYGMANAGKGSSAQVITRIVIILVTPGSPNPALVALKMARKVDPFRESVQILHEPWVVEAALARFGDKRLTLDEQAVVVKSTSAPQTVRWPDWWQYKPDHPAH